MNLINKNYTFFSHDQCEFFPCHNDREDMGCLFCFCPLYTRPDCGGDFTFTEKGLKDCSRCFRPHDPETGYEFVMKKISFS